MTPRRLALAAGLTALVVLAGAITLHVARPRPLHLPEARRGHLGAAPAPLTAGRNVTSARFGASVSSPDSI